jgi:hypothetical protein
LKICRTDGGTNLKGFLKSYGKYLLAGFIVFVIIIPVLINCLFKLEAPVSFLVAEWSAGDALSFYGALIASVATIIGVYLSIDYAQQNYREDAKSRIKPYLALTHIVSRSKYDFFGPENNNSTITPTQTELYTEFRLDRVYIVLSKKGIEFKDGLTSQQQQLLEQVGCTWKAHGTGYVLVSTDYVSLPFEVDNVGNGAALNFKIAFYKKDSAEHKGVSLYTLKSNSTVYFHIFSELEDDGLLGDYVLDLRYHDIQGTYYAQKYPLHFERRAEDNKVSQTIDLTGQQEVIKEEIS